MNRAAERGTGLVVEGVSKTYRRSGSSVRALDRLSLVVRPGEVVALLGNNGAGKSTLMNIVAGLVAADEGRVLVGGHDVTAPGAGPSSDLGYAPQEEALYPTLTVERNLRYFGRLSGLRGSELEGRIKEVARHLLIDDRLDRRAGTLSGGQRRRLHTGLALMHRPSVLLLDEPTVGVDIGAREELLAFVADTARSGAAVLYSTHQFHEVETLDARVVVIDQGQVRDAGTVADVVARHAPHATELHFDRADVPLPDDLLGAVDEAGWTPGDHYRVVARLAHDDVHVAEVIDHLDPGTREHLVAAAVLEPSLERAYRRLTRDGSAGVPAAAGSAGARPTTAAGTRRDARTSGPTATDGDAA